MCFFHMFIMMFTFYVLRATNPKVKIFCLNMVGSFRQGFWLNYTFLLHHYMVLDPMSFFKWSAYTLWLVTSDPLEVDITTIQDIFMSVHFILGTVLLEKSEVNKMFCLHFLDFSKPTRNDRY